MHNIAIRWAFVCLVAVLLALTGFSLSTKQGHIDEGSHNTLRLTDADTVAGFIEEAQTDTDEGDNIVPIAGTKLKARTEVRIMQAVPVTILVDGQTIKAKPHALTVREAIRQTDIVLQEFDKVSPSLAQQLRPGMVIKIKRVQVETQVVQEDVPYSQEILLDDRLEKGLSRVIRPGRPGEARVFKENVIVEHRLAKQRVSARHILKHPVPELIAMGNSTTISRGGQKINFSRAIRLEATAYEPSSRSNGQWAGITAMGTKLRHGIVAVDPKVIPLGSRLYVDGYGFAVAEDTGGDIKGQRIDLCFPTYQEAMDYGRQQVKVYLLD